MRERLSSSWRSVRVVFPASAWANIPILLGFLVKGLDC